MKTAKLTWTNPRGSSPSQNAAAVKGRILTVSSYLPTLRTWQMLLESQGYHAVSFLLTKGREEDLLRQKPFDVIILGQSLDDKEKKRLIDAFRQCSSAPIISVHSRGGEPSDSADIHTEPDPEQLLSAITKLIQSERHPATLRRRVG